MIVTVIPAYNEPRQRLLASVASAVEVSDLVVVSDDGSREPIEPIDGVEIVRNNNAGPAAAMNRGVDAAIGMGATRIARLDVGDWFIPDAKRRQLEIDAPAVASWHINAVDGLEFRPQPKWWNVIYRDGVFCICTCVVSADVWREVGGFDESLVYGDDWEWSIRVQHVIGWTIFEEPTCHAGAFDGGHTMSAERDERKKQIKNQCTREILRRARLMRGHL